MDVFKTLVIYKSFLQSFHLKSMKLTSRASTNVEVAKGCFSMM